MSAEFRRLILDRLAAERQQKMVDLATRRDDYGEMREFQGAIGEIQVAMDIVDSVWKELGN